MDEFSPTRHAALLRLAAVDPARYAQTRNALDGAVTRLSPYLTHGILSLREVYTQLALAQTPPAALNMQHKLVFELGWRAYWQHCWQHLGEAIHQSRHAGPLPDSAYQQALPDDILTARTGIATVDRAVQQLQETGYLHNHARLWLASYWVHIRKVHWHCGAQWMLGHLLDGDIASNHLSWQWVAGTGSNKPYVFNADNVAKYAPPPWHCHGTILDTDYATLEALARNPLPAATGEAVQAVGVAPPGVLQPLHATPPAGTWQAPSAEDLRGQDVWLTHPWSLGDLPPKASGKRVIAIAIPAAHARMPWSARRWAFVSAGLQHQTPTLWWGSAQALAAALASARTVQWRANPHIDKDLQALCSAWAAPPLGPVPKAHPVAALFAAVPDACPSFSLWWRRTALLTS